MTRPRRLVWSVCRWVVHLSSAWYLHIYTNSITNIMTLCVAQLLHSACSDVDIQRVNNTTYSGEFCQEFTFGSDSGRLTFLKETARSPEWLCVNYWKVIPQFVPLNNTAYSGKFLLGNSLLAILSLLQIAKNCCTYRSTVFQTWTVIFCLCSLSPAIAMLWTPDKTSVYLDTRSIGKYTSITIPEIIWQFQAW